MRSVASRRTADAGQSSPRKSSGTASRTTSKRTSAHLAAQRQQRVENQRTGIRKSTRLAAREAQVNSASTSSSASTDSEYSAPRTPKRNAYKAVREARIGHITPQYRITSEDSRPHARDVAAVAPTGSRCAGSGKSKENKTVQVSHIVDRATPAEELKEFEKASGVLSESINLDQRLNLVLLSSEIHIPFDNRLLIIIPTRPDLEKLYVALNKKVVIGWTGEKAPRKNKAGFIHHEEIFPFLSLGRDCRMIPLLNWADAPIVIIKHLPDGTTKERTIRRPFTTPTGRPQLPLAKLHGGPHFFSFKAYKTLTHKDLANKDVVPAYAKEDVRLVMKIGRIMDGIDAPEVA
ncbi:uncharacterized protein SCHCODRAFT_02516922 [Schizophyllum commune H4-8]|uniref:HNH nuclease domain-containing protein n=1 Tax=Schizophyllum commune (strain H4-8 / FGSC 9210) TaxID=578458 RepID=D8QGT5_SCHCM|nr:uncharacterized protein SCHCODRAFT_02516922 [Schizophyllum commune H4-8]KAI5886877.1 hypothetical protein SCHCODRAFT_02516922 [Schizophyllum commune H4-8]